MKPLDTVAILGVGLMGGSVGLALRERKLARQVVGLGRNSSRLRSARRRGAVTATSTRWRTGGAGADLVVSGRSRGVDITPVVSKVASGAAETQPIARVANLARFLKALQDLNIWIVGTDEGGAASLYESNLTGALAIVMGAEGKGLRRLTRERCDTLVRLPMKGSVESLNISVAAGICLYEAVRQRS